MERLQIYSGIRVVGYYKKIRDNDKGVYLPTIPPDIFYNALSKINSHSNLEKELSDEMLPDKEIVDFCFHEVRKLNATVKKSAESLSKYISTMHEHDKKNLIQTIFAASTLITNRLSMYDFENNNDILNSNHMYDGSIFDKFKKASHCLEQMARNSKVVIAPFDGNLYKKHNIRLHALFDFVPFVILENAIKYSPPDHDVCVKFSHGPDFIEVKITSVGPKIEDADIENIFNKKYRGKYATALGTSGGGYGLYFANEICKTHNVSITISPMDQVKYWINSIPYASFIVTLRYENTFY